MTYYRLVLEEVNEGLDVEEVLTLVSQSEAKQHLTKISKYAPSLKRGAAILAVLAALGAAGFWFAKLRKKSKSTKSDTKSLYLAIVVTALIVFAGFFILFNKQRWKEGLDTPIPLKEDTNLSWGQVRETVKIVLNQVRDEIVTIVRVAVSDYLTSVGITDVPTFVAFVGAGLALIAYIKIRGYTVSEVYKIALETIKQGRAAKIVIGAAVVIVLALGAYFMYRTRRRQGVQMM